MGEMIQMLKKKHNMFEVLYGWFLAKACFYTLSLLHFQVLIFHSFRFKNAAFLT